MQVTDPAPDFPASVSVPPEYEMVMQALEKNPDDRQRSVDEIRQVLMKLV